MLKPMEFFPFKSRESERGGEDPKVTKIRFLFILNTIFYFHSIFSLIFHIENIKNFRVIPGNAGWVSSDFIKS